MHDAAPACGSSPTPCLDRACSGLMPTFTGGGCPKIQISCGVAFSSCACEIERVTRGAWFIEDTLVMMRLLESNYSL